MMRARGAGISILGGLFFHFGIPCALPQDGPWGKFSKRSVLMMLVWGALGGLKNYSKIRARKREVGNVAGQMAVNKNGCVSGLVQVRR